MLAPYNLESDLPLTPWRPGRNGRRAWYAGWACPVGQASAARTALRTVRTVLLRALTVAVGPLALLGTQLAFSGLRLLWSAWRGRWRRVVEMGWRLGLGLWHAAESKTTNSSQQSHALAMNSSSHARPLGDSSMAGMAGGRVRFCS